MKKNSKVQRSLFSWKQYLIFFLLIAAVVTFSFLLFWNFLDIEVKDIGQSALLTFGNVLFLTLIFCIVDGLRRRITVEKPVKRILDATHRLTEGDFSARIEPLHTLGKQSEFDLIIENFNTMAAELSSLETLRTDFVANVSHELKTPLSVIQNYATMLGAPDLSEKKRLEYAGSIAGASRRLSELITNVLRLNSLENQQIFPAPQKYDLAEQLRECLLGFEEMWESKNLTIETDIQEMHINGDTDLLSLVWNNLISNAVKFTPPGGTITVRLYAEGETAVVEVADTGCGMAPDVGRHIFERFYQGDESHAMQGNGLGLALVKRVVDILGGEIAVKSTLGKGSAFTVKIGSGLDAAG